MPFPKIKLSDDSGNAVSVTDNRLNVNAYLSATPTIDIGDVSLLLDGTAADYGTGNVNTSGRTLRVTLASDDYHFGEKGTAADHDGTIHGQLRYIGDQVKNAYDELVAIDADTNVLLLTAHTEDSAHSNADIGTMSLAVRNDTLASLVSDDGDYAPFQVNANGALYITGGEVENAAVQSEPLLIGGRYDSSARTLDDGDAGAVALNASGHMIMDVVDGGQLDTIIDTLETTLTAIETDQAAIEALLITIDSDTDAIKTAIQILDDWDDSNYANVNINLAGSDAPTGGGTESGALRVTLANDSTGVISIDDGGNTITVDGTVDLGSTATTHLSEIEGAVETIEGAISGSEMQVDIVSSATLSVNSHAVTNAGTFVTQVDGDALTALQLIDDAVHVDDAGFTLGTHKGVMMMGFAGTQSVDANDAAALACNQSGFLKVTLAGQLSAFVNASDETLGTSTYSETSTTGSVIGVVRNDTLAALAGTDNEIAPLQVDAQGALYTTHGMTGLASDDNPTVGTSAEAITTDGADGAAACKRMDIMSHPANTGEIWVGDAAVTTNGANGGIRLLPGDVYSIDIDNTGDVYVVATVNGENVCYNYYT